MRINHNIAALRANNTLGKNNSMLDKSLERLSSGYRINHAADDAAGMAISQKMRTQIAGLDQASRNASDGISVIQTAEGALNEVETMLQRMRELAVQSANGTNTDEDRQAIQQEIEELRNEILRISNTTEYNTKTLLDGNIDCKSYSSHEQLQVISQTDQVEIKDYNIKVTQDARQAVLVCEDFTGAKEDQIGVGGKININGLDVEVSSTDTYEQVFQKLKSTCDTMNVRVFAGNYLGPGEEMADGNPSSADYAFYEPVTLGDGPLVFMTKEYGSSESIEIHCNSQALSTVFGLNFEGASAKGVDAKAELVGGFKNSATVSTSGNIITISDLDGFEIKLRSEAGAANTDYNGIDATGTTEQSEPGASEEIDVTVNLLEAGPMDLQIGANEGQTMIVRIPKVDPETLGIENLNLGTEAGSQRAIATLDLAIQQVSSVRAKLGAYQNRLDHAIANLDVSSENITESLSRIEDTNMAEEMATYTQKNVLVQANTAMLAQANERPQTILSLIQG